MRLKAALIKQVAQEEKEALKKSFKANPLILKAIRNLLKDEEEAILSSLSSKELLTKRNFDKHLAALLAELRVYRYLQGILND